MNPVKVVSAAFLVVDLGLRAGGFHLDVASYHGEPQPSQPLGAIVATATAQVVMPVDSYLSRIPL